jgi:hypothetical protein
VTRRPPQTGPFFRCSASAGRCCCELLSLVAPHENRVSGTTWIRLTPARSVRTATRTHRCGPAGPARRGSHHNSTVLSSSRTRSQHSFKPLEPSRQQQANLTYAPSAAMSHATYASARACTTWRAATAQADCGTAPSVERGSPPSKTAIHAYRRSRTRMLCGAPRKYALQPQPRRPQPIKLPTMRAIAHVSCQSKSSTE